MFDNSDVSHVWSGFVPDDDVTAVMQAGYGGPVELGRRPCLLVIDATRNFTGDMERGALATATREYPNSSESAARAVPVVEDLLVAARSSGVPVIYTRGPLFKDRLSLGGWAMTNPKMLVGDDRAGESFLDQLRPSDEELVLEKLCPSAFFGTPLLRHLRLLDVDTLVVCGASTSGCIRATVVDSFSHGFRTGVVSDGCWDRSDAGHALSMFDMHFKYGEVVTSPTALAYLRQGYTMHQKE